MIWDEISHMESYGFPFAGEILRLLRERDFAALDSGFFPTGTHGLRCIVSRYSTSLSEKPFEVHEREADVQVMLSGRERIDFAGRGKGDVSLSGGGSLLLNRGEFAVFFPGELHKPGLADRGSEDVVKVIFKILVGG